MLYLVLSILFSTGVFVAMRLFERFKLDNHQALMWNYVFAAGTGFLMCKQFDTPGQLVAEPWFGLSLITGFWFIFTYLLMTASTQRSGVTITSLSSKLSVVLPTLAGVVLFSERLNFVASMGIVLALVALVGGRRQERDFQDQQNQLVATNPHLFRHRHGRHSHETHRAKEPSQRYEFHDCLHLFHRLAVRHPHRGLRPPSWPLEMAVEKCSRRHRIGGHQLFLHFLRLSRHALLRQYRAVPRI